VVGVILADQLGALVRGGKDSTVCISAPAPKEGASAECIRLADRSGTLIAPTLIRGVRGPVSGHGPQPSRPHLWILSRLGEARIIERCATRSLSYGFTCYDFLPWPAGPPHAMKSALRKASDSKRSPTFYGVEIGDFFAQQRLASSPIPKPLLPVTSAHFGNRCPPTALDPLLYSLWTSFQRDKTSW